MERTISDSEFEEYTYIIKGKKQFIIDEETIVLEAGQSIKIEKIHEFNIQIHLTNHVSISRYASLHLTSPKCIENNK
jgi:uncharacterized cupin superfamily protein